MTSIQDYRRLCRKHTSKYSWKSSLPPKFNYDKLSVDSPIADLVVSLFRPFIAKYTKKNLQKIFKIILKTQAFLFNRSCKKSLKARLPNIYFDKCHIECYNFYQQCEDYYTIAGAKSLNCILFGAFFLRNCINFLWQ